MSRTVHSVPESTAFRISRTARRSVPCPCKKRLEEKREALSLSPPLALSAKTHQLRPSTSSLEYLNRAGLRKESRLLVTVRAPGEVAEVVARVDDGTIRQVRVRDEEALLYPLERGCQVQTRSRRRERRQRVRVPLKCLSTDQSAQIGTNRAPRCQGRGGAHPQHSLHRPLTRILYARVVLH